MNQDEKKRSAALAALEFVEDDMIVGVGTGSTIAFFIDGLAEMRDRIRGAVSSSETSTEQLKAHGIEVLDLNLTGNLDLYVDGADEADRHLNLIKGGGGALTREKIIAAASRKFVCVVDDTKLVRKLGRFPLPVEVIPMSRAYVARQMVVAGGQPEWRQGFVSDNGNYILDVHNLDILNPRQMESDFNQIAGVVTVGLFARRPADVVLVGEDDGVRRVESTVSRAMS